MIYAFVQDASGVGSVYKEEGQERGKQSSRSTDRQDEKESCGVIRYMYQIKINIYTK
jgi:hypothetical protein